jgi:hypothetical protein
VKNDPTLSNPRSGSGEAVCGIFTSATCSGAILPVMCTAAVCVSVPPQMLLAVIV